jgi:DNA-binding transcriptional LysR family regulator
MYCSSGEAKPDCVSCKSAKNRHYLSEKPIGRETHVIENLTLDQLRLFVSVVEEGSFSAAGRQLNRVQSAVSQGISNLEEALGVALFDRTGRLPKLTASGQSLLLDAQRIFTQVSQLRTRAAGISEGLEAVVSVAVDAIVPAELVVSMCRGFQAEFPTVALRIQTEVLDAVVALVLEGSCQLGIAGPIGIDRPDLTRRFLAHVAMVPVAGAGHPLATLRAPIATAAVRDQIQVVISQRGHDSGADHGVLSGHTWRVADASTKLALMRADLGWGTLPCAMVKEDLERGTLVQLQFEEWGPEPLQAPLSSVVRSGAPPGPAGQWLLSELNRLCE